MSFRVVQDDITKESFIHFFNRNKVFMARVPMPEDFELYSDSERHDYLRTHHIDLIKRIR